MRARLTDVVVQKMRSDFPALNINQIAAKYGVGWITAKNAVAPDAPKAAKKHGKRKAADNGRGEIEVVKMHLDSFWNGLSTAAKIQFLLGKVRGN